LHRIVKFVVGCCALLACAGCNTLENRRDLYSTDFYFYRERPVRTVRHTTTTTTTTSAPEFHPRAADPEEVQPLPGN
jgi:hypothetical protein